MSPGNRVFRCNFKSKLFQVILELQGDLEARIDNEQQPLNNQFCGDLLFNKYGQPILIIGHHILFGKEIKMEKPFALIEKCERSEDSNETIDMTQLDVSLLDSTINIENRTKPNVEYLVKCLIKKKLVFKSRPKPIISNVAKKV